MKDGYIEVNIPSFWNVAKEFHKLAAAELTEQDDPAVPFYGEMTTDDGTFYCEVVYKVSLGAVIPTMRLFKKDETKNTQIESTD
jgi:hypothetical protein